MTSNERVVGRAKAFLAACGSTSQVVRTGPWGMLSSLPPRSSQDQIVPGWDVNPSFLLYCTLYWQPCGTACFSPVQKLFELFFKLWLLVLQRWKRWAHRHRSVIPEFEGQRQEDYCRFEANLAFIVRSKSTELHRETLSRKKERNLLWDYSVLQTALCPMCLGIYH